MRQIYSTIDLSYDNCILYFRKFVYQLFKDAK